MSGPYFGLKSNWLSVVENVENEMQIKCNFQLVWR